MDYKKYFDTRICNFDTSVEQSTSMQDLKHYYEEIGVKSRT